MSGRDTQRPTLGPREIVHQNPYHHVYRRVADFGTFTKEYFVTAYGTRAAVVVARGEEILLSRQYRLLLDRLSWEIPGGKVEQGETLEGAAIRECLEETGIRCRALTPLVAFQQGLDVLESSTHVFYTHSFAEEGGSSHDVREAEPPVWVPLERCLEMVFAKEMLDSLAAIAILAYQFRVRHA